MVKKSTLSKSRKSKPIRKSKSRKSKPIRKSKSRKSIGKKSKRKTKTRKSIRKKSKRKTKTRKSKGKKSKKSKKQKGGLFGNRIEKTKKLEDFQECNLHKKCDPREYRCDANSKLQELQHFLKSE